MDEPIFWTIRQNWDGKLWPRLWPNQRFAWREVVSETGMSRAEIRKTCDWSLVPVALIAVVLPRKPKAKAKVPKERAEHLASLRASFKAAEETARV